MYYKPEKYSSVGSCSFHETYNNVDYISLCKEVEDVLVAPKQIRLVAIVQWTVVSQNTNVSG